MKSGTFDHNENIIVHNKNGKRVGYMPLQRPHHKSGTKNSPEIAAGLGDPSTYAETYEVNPFDKKAPAPGKGYSPTSTLMNIAINKLAKRQKFYGFIKKGFKV
jgi:hypothetical protein